MKREISALLTILLVAGFTDAVFAQPAPATNAPVKNNNSIGNEEGDIDEKKKLEQDERIKELEKENQERSKREAVREEELKDRLAREAQRRDMDALRESAPDATEYTISPSSVELVVEMDPNNYGFRRRSHRMTMAAEFDLLIRGRAMLHYDYRFFEYLSFGVKGGIDWTAMSLWSRFGQESSKLVPKQLSVLGGISSKWRLTEWYMQSAFFLEPSVLFGYMWQTLPSQETKHWRIRPGLFGVIERVYDSGLVFNMAMGAEFPFDFGTANPVREIVEPVFLLGFGLAI